MKLHYKGIYNLNPESLPHGEHMEGAVKFKEFENSTQSSIVGTLLSLAIISIMGAITYIRLGELPLGSQIQLSLGFIFALLTLFPHELLHAVCFKENVYLYVNLKQFAIYVVGTETMSKRRFIFMSMFPNIVFGIIPYTIGMIFPQFTFGLVLGILATGMGAVDYYNVFNALMQMPKGSRTYMYKFNSYWYMP